MKMLRVLWLATAAWGLGLYEETETVLTFYEIHPAGTFEGHGFSGTGSGAGMAYNTALFKSPEDAGNRTNVLGRVTGFAGASDQITPYLTGLYNFHFFDSDSWIVASAGVAFVPATPSAEIKFEFRSFVGLHFYFLTWSVSGVRKL